ncbi:tail fiber assembly protein [Enterobacter cloacae]|nr:tail fiber assembly protein [Enterobacter cloacae]
MHEEAIIDSNFIATKAGNIKVFNYDHSTKEFLGSSVEFLALGVGIPADSCVDAPPPAYSGFAVVRNTSTGEWELIEDHRGEIVYSKENRVSLTISELGEYPEGYTLLKPATEFDVWNGDNWVTDEDAKRKAALESAELQRQSLIDEANNYMNNKQWPGKAAMGRLKGEDANNYNTWLDYLDSLELTDISNAPEIEWPEKPVL